jgi:hypothetical protein
VNVHLNRGTITAASTSRRRPRCVGVRLALALALGAVVVSGLVLALAGPATATGGFNAVEGQPLAATVVVGSFLESCLSPMSCSQLAPAVETITWGDGSTSTPSTCDINTDVPGSTCWLSKACDPPTGCTFSLFAPGHVYAEEGTDSGSFFWNDPSPGGARLVTTPFTATVASAPLTNPAGAVFNAVAGQAFSNVQLASFADAAPGDHSADLSGTIDWGDGTPATTCGPVSAGDPCVIEFASGVYSVLAGHTYGQAGTFSPTVVINDRGGSQTEAHATANVSAAAPTPGIGSAPGRLTASVVSVATSGPGATIVVACQGPSGETCRGVAILQVKERRHGTSVVAVSAATPTRGHVTTTTVTVAQGSFAISVGHRTTVHLTLSSAARRLLARFYRLPAALTFSGTSIAARTITFAYPKITSLILYTIAFTPTYSTVQDLTIHSLPKGATVAIACRGHGCPFSRRSLKPDGTQAHLTKLLAGAHLGPHTQLLVTVTALNRVGEVLVITIRRGAQPTGATRCLPPGARSPQVCA